MYPIKNCDYCGQGHQPIAKPLSKGIMYCNDHHCIQERTGTTLVEAAKEAQALLSSTDFKAIIEHVEPAVSLPISGIRIYGCWLIIWRFEFQPVTTQMNEAYLVKTDGIHPGEYSYRTFRKYPGKEAFLYH